MGRVALVTGGAGFIGSNIATALVERGDTVRIIDNFFSGRKENIEHLRDDLELIEGDIRDREAVAAAMAGVDLVFHQAAIPSVARSVADPVATHEVNATGTLNIAVAARDADVSAVVYASSSSLYGDAERMPVVEDDLPRPISPYAVSKYAGERYLVAFTAVYGLPTISLRYFNVFGPRQDPASDYAAVVPLFATRSLRGEKVTIYGDGQQYRDFSYIGDVVAANLMAADSGPGAHGRAFNIAGGGPHTVMQLLETVRSFVAMSPVDPDFAPPRLGEVRMSHADISAAAEAFGWAPTWTFEDGLEATVAWFAAREP